MKTVAIIQARMGSSRLPRKVLKRICGRTMLEHVLRRIKACREIDEVVVATTTAPADGAIVKACRQYGAAFFCGSEKDVLDRFYQTATHFKADQIVRITADCPLIDPDVVGKILRHHLDSGADYTSNTLKRTYPRGLDTEVFSYKAISRASQEATKPEEREHVTPYFYRHPELFRLGTVEGDLSPGRPDIRICVDTPEDLALVRRIFRALEGTKMGVEDIVQLFERKPEYLEMNSAIQQKAV
jgi:spore coat polysaccharide biosynthesis protein SpsF